MQLHNRLQSSGEILTVNYEEPQQKHSGDFIATIYSMFILLHLPEQVGDRILLISR